MITFGFLMAVVVTFGFLMAVAVVVVVVSSVDDRRNLFDGDEDRQM